MNFGKRLKGYFKRDRHSEVVDVFHIILRKFFGEACYIRLGNFVGKFEERCACGSSAFHGYPTIWATYIPGSGGWGVAPLALFQKVNLT